MTANEIFDECTALLNTIPDIADIDVMFDGRFIIVGSIFKADLLELSIIPETPTWCAHGICRCILNRFYNDDRWLTNVFPG